MIRLGTVAHFDRSRRFRGFRKFNGFRGFLFSRFSESSRFSGFWVPFWASELKNHVYDLIDADPRIQRDERFRDHLRGAVSSAPRLIAEGFGRYLPGDFSGYLRKANGELKETLECLRDGVDRGYFTHDQIVRGCQEFCV